MNSHSSGVAPGRARSTFTISPHTSTVAFGKRLYCDTRIIAGVEFARSRCRGSARARPQQLGDHVTNRMPVRDLRHRARFGVLRAHAAPLRAYERVPYHLARTLPGRDAGSVRRSPGTRRCDDPRCAVSRDVVHRPEHLVMDALHVIRLREPVGGDLPVARDRRSGRDGAAEVVEVRPRRVPGTPSRNSSSAPRRGRGSRTPAGPTRRPGRRTARARRRRAGRTIRVTGSRGACPTGPTSSGGTGSAAR